MIPECPAHGLIVHVRLVLVEPPQPGDRLAVHQLEDTLLSVGPLDELGAAVLVLQQLQQELPEVGGRALSGLPLAGDTVWTDLGRAHLLLGSLEGALVGGEGGGVVEEVFSLWRGGVGVEVGHPRGQERGGWEEGGDGGEGASLVFRGGVGGVIVAKHGGHLVPGGGGVGRGVVALLAGGVEVGEEGGLVGGRGVGVLQGS